MTDFHIEMKENTALIIFDQPTLTAYMVSVQDPKEFSVKIYKTILKHYQKIGDIEKYTKLKVSGFNYLDYVNK